MIVYIVLRQDDYVKTAHVFQSRKSAEAKFVAIAKELTVVYRNICEEDVFGSYEDFPEYSINDFKDAQNFIDSETGPLGQLWEFGYDLEIHVSRIEFTEEN